MIGLDDMRDQIIAPVPNKAQGLTQPFIRDSYDKAVSILRQSSTVVSIGYSFNRHDQVSYGPLLDAIRTSQNKRLLVVCPDADQVVQMLDNQGLSVEAIKKTFKQWVCASFPGLP